MELKSGVIICPTIEESKRLFAFLHENGVTWGSGDPLIEGDGQFHFFSDGINRGYEIETGWPNNPLVFTFSLDFVTSKDLEETKNIRKAKDNGLFWISGDEYIAAHGENPNLKIDFDVLRALL